MSIEVESVALVTRKFALEGQAHTFVVLVTLPDGGGVIAWVEFEGKRSALGLDVIEKMAVVPVPAV